MRTLLALLAAALLLAAPAAASPFIRFGVQDDRWLERGPGTLPERLELLERLGVDTVRYTLRWDRVAAVRPASPGAFGDEAYDWSAPDAVLRGLRGRGIRAVVTLYGTPRWANGGRPPHLAPRAGAGFAAFAFAAASRYPWVREWTIWDEPNRRERLQPASPRLYVERLLNPAYAAVHRASPRARVGGGETAARGDVGPFEWIRAMRAAGARLDAYAHHPYPASRDEPPLASLADLVREVGRSFGNARVWLTEYGVETDRRGVSEALQARALGQAALRAYRTRRVDLLVQYLVEDEPAVSRSQTGLFTADGTAKIAAQAFSFPLAQVVRRDEAVLVWGQIRPRDGRQPFRLQVLQGGRATWVGGARLTSTHGYFTALVTAPPGALVRIWSLRDRLFGAPVLLS